ncbi:MAG: TIGR03085 family metal-binding protein, partial [Acidimicrobiales bacterium]
MSVAVSFADAERAYLADALERLGPDAPTLCEGWTARDLAIHLVIRERRPDAAPGMVLPALSGWTDKVMAARRQDPYPELVGKVRTGPPVWSPFAVPGVAGLANPMEYFVHHEDVRRAQPGWEPRELDADVEDLIWSRLRRQARLMFRKAPVGVTLHREDTGAEAVAKASTPIVTLTGRPGELLLYSFGRRSAARVSLEGDTGAIARLEAADVGL